MPCTQVSGSDGGGGEKSVKMTRNYAKRQYTWFNNQFSKFDMVINTVPNSETFVPIIS